MKYLFNFFNVLSIIITTTTIIQLDTPQANEILSPKQGIQLTETKQLSSKAVSLARKGDIEKAITLAKRSLSIREKLLGPNHYSTATVLNNLGSFSSQR